MKIKNILRLSLILVTTQIFAKVPDEGFYIEAGAGVSNISYLSSNASSWVARVDGGYNASKYVGFQLGLNNYSNTSMTNITYGDYNVSGFGADLSIIPNFPLDTKGAINIFGRVGVGYDVMNSTAGNQSATIDIIGAGLRYDISAHLTVSTQWIGRGLITKPSPSDYSQNDFLANIGINF